VSLVSAGRINKDTPPLTTPSHTSKSSAMDISSHIFEVVIHREVQGRFHPRPGPPSHMIRGQKAYLYSRNKREGCEKRRGECLGTPTARCLARPGGRVDPESKAGNAANPMTGSGMQQARNLPSGGSRRGGAKPRGRNTIPRQAASGPNRVGSNVDSGEWTLGRHAGGGESRHPTSQDRAGRKVCKVQLTARAVGKRSSVCRTNPRRGGRNSDQGDR
jgi:hypothetical protein